MRNAKCYRARITASGKTHTLGFFKTAEEAHAAYKKAAAERHTHNPHAQIDGSTA